MEKKSILMLGPSLGGRGGIARVVQLIIENWKSDQFVIKPIVTHKDGGAVIKILSFLSGLLQ